MDTILVGYDNTESSRRALERAADLAAAEGARLVVVAVAELPLSPQLPVTDEFLDAVPVSVEAVEPPDVEAALSRAREALSGRDLEVDLVWAAGEPASSLLEVAEQRDGDLIVLGYHHESILVRLFGGGVADEIAAGARCDVLVVR